MRSGTIAFLFGTLLLQQLAHLPPLWLVLPAAVGLLLLRRYPGGGEAARLALWFMAGLLCALLRATLVLSEGLPAALEGEDVVVEGEVISLPVHSPRRTRFEFSTSRLQFDDRWRPGIGRIRLGWYGQAPKIEPGQRWRLTVRLKRPNGLLNPGGFDYETWLYRQQIRATGYVRSDGEATRLDAGWVARPLQRLRYTLLGRLEQALSEHPQAGLVTALTIGDRRGLDTSQWTVLTATGTNHLVAISGLHIGLLAGLAFLLVRWVWGAIPGAAQRLPAIQAAAGAAIVAAAGYAALAGFAIPTQRALVMVGVAMTGILLRRRTGGSNLLALALLAVLLFDPTAVLAPGFWLSFAAVAAILYGMSGRLAPRGLWWRWGRVQWVVAVGLAPLLLHLFGQAAPSAPLANLLAVPWVGFVVVPLALAGAALVLFSPSLGGWLLQWAADALGAMWVWLSWLAAHAPAGAAAGAVPLWATLVGVAGALWFLAPRGWPARPIGLVAFLPLFLPASPAPAPGALWMTVLDAGQGLAVVLRTRNHTLIYDTGPPLGAQLDVGSAALLPFLRGRGIDHLDRIIVSDGDQDHAGGLASLAAGVTHGPVLSGTPARLPVEATPCRRGMQWRRDGVTFRILHPAGAESGGNNRACVLLVESPYGRILLPGDIEKGGERTLLNADAPLKADVLVAPHHGSRSSSTEPFVRAIDPRWVVFSSGYQNRYGHPHPEVAARYRRHGTKLLRTAEGGALHFRLTPDGISVQSQREAAARYWRRR